MIDVPAGTPCWSVMAERQVWRYQPPSTGMGSSAYRSMSAAAAAGRPGADASLAPAAPVSLAASVALAASLANSMP